MDASWSIECIGHDLQECSKSIIVYPDIGITEISAVTGTVYEGGQIRIFTGGYLYLEESYEIKLMQDIIAWEIPHSSGE